MTVGRTVVNEDVFVDIAQASMQNVEEIIRRDKKGALSDLGRLFTGRLASQVNVKKSDNSEEGATLGSVSFELKLTVVYGVNIPEVANKVRDAVAKDVNTITGYEVERVDVLVEKMVHPGDDELEPIE